MISVINELYLAQLLLGYLLHFGDYKVGRKGNNPRGSKEIQDCRFLEFSGDFQTIIDRMG